MTPKTDSLDADSPDDADNNSAYPKSIHLYLCNHNHNREISPNTKKHDPQH